MLQRRAQGGEVVVQRPVPLGGAGRPEGWAVVDESFDPGVPGCRGARLFLVQGVAADGGELGEPRRPVGAGGSQRGQQGAVDEAGDDVGGVARVLPDQGGGEIGGEGAGHHADRRCSAASGSDSAR